MARFFDWSIVGLDGWSFPEQWTMVYGDRLVSFWWNRVPGQCDGGPCQAPAFSILHYAGDGLFDYELDLMNVVEVTEVLGKAEWAPGEGFRFPEPDPDRDPTPPRLPSAVMEPWELSAREGIRDGLARYTWSGDSGRLDELVLAFCEDGVLEVRGQEPLEGRDAIRVFIGGVADAGAERPGGTVRHNLANVRFLEVDTRVGPRGQLLHGVHRDRPRPLRPLPGPVRARRRRMADPSPLRLHRLARPELDDGPERRRIARTPRAA